MTETIGAIVSSPRKLCFTLLSGKLTLGPLGSVPMQQLYVIMSRRLGQSHPSYLINNAAGSRRAMGGGGGSVP